MTTLDTLFTNAKTKFDLTEPADQESLYVLTEALLALSDLALDALQEAARRADAPLEFKLAVKLADARRYGVGVKRPLNIGVVFAMWGEQNRLHPKSDDNPNGEDSLRTKIEQLHWATEGTTIDWTLYAVDDGCPYDSGKIAQEIADLHPLGDRVKVLFLGDAVPTDSGPLRELKSPNDSRKAGAIILGCMQALADGKDAVIYTDADNSVHLGQIGLLLRPFLENGRRVVLGNRKHPDAVLVKQEGRWGIGLRCCGICSAWWGRPFSRAIFWIRRPRSSCMNAPFCSKSLRNQQCLTFRLIPIGCWQQSAWMSLLLRCHLRLSTRRLNRHRLRRDQ